MKRIGIIDYGMGNLRSVQNACAHVGISAFTSARPEELARAHGLILPGVGAFPDAMSCLEETGLKTLILDTIKTRPLLGICLGMQLLFEKSFEVRPCAGLGLIPGEVVRLTAGELDGSYKTPHMGWNSLDLLRPDSPLMAGQNGRPFVYFVHSYKAVPRERDDIVAVTGHGEEICAAVSRNNIYGVQFHPEKSEETGLRMLSAFAGLL